MNYLNQLQKGIDYIENNLDEDIQLTDVSAAANMSHWHFQRIFKALTNETLKAYIRSRRIANSMNALFNQESTILDIAIASGFESHESYTRAFQKLFGITPSEYRKKAENKLFVQKTKLSPEYLQNLHANLLLEPRFYSTNERHFVGIRTEVVGVESEKNNIADKLPDLWNAFIPRLNEVEHSIDGTLYGIINQEPSDNGATLFYMACAEVTHVENHLPTGMSATTLPAQHYAEFRHQGLVDVTSVNQTINYIYSSWLLNSDKRHTYQADIEIYGPEFKMSSEDSVIYYAIPIDTI